MKNYIMTLVLSTSLIGCSPQPNTPTHKSVPRYSYESQQHSELPLVDVSVPTWELLHPNISLPRGTVEYGIFVNGEEVATIASDSIFVTESGVFVATTDSTRLSHLTHYLKWHKKPVENLLKFPNL